MSSDWAKRHWLGFALIGVQMENAKTDPLLCCLLGLKPIREYGFALCSGCWGPMQHLIEQPNFTEEAFFSRTYKKVAQFNTNAVVFPLQFPGDTHVWKLDPPSLAEPNQLTIWWIGQITAEVWVAWVAFRFCGPVGGGGISVLCISYIDDRWL